MTRWRSESGASAVEFALLLPILVSLLFGAITGAMSYNRKVALTHSSREGARWAVVLPTGSTPTTSVPDAWFDAVVDRTVASAGGELPAGDASRYVCVAYVEDGTFSDGVNPPVARTRRQVVSGTTVTRDIGQTCFADGITGTEPRVQVVTGRDTRFDAVFVRRTIGLRAEAVARFELESSYPAPAPSPSP